jgi:iron-sulfur cluster repair protein YtfE (RIC family)
MPASEIRREITGQHAEIRKLLAEIESLARRFEESAGGAPDVGHELHQHGLSLYQRFGAHLDREQALLEPALRGGGPEGEQRARRLRNEHHEQRELLRYLISRLESHPEPTLLIARELQNFAGFLRFEMAHEEETLLSDAALAGVGA